jgi:hypothetical protein
VAWLPPAAVALVADAPPVEFEPPVELICVLVPALVVVCELDSLELPPIVRGSEFCEPLLLQPVRARPK